MAKVLPGIDEELAAWLAAQPVYFIATAPLAGDGHINLSPRGHDTFRVLGPLEVAFYDLTGSGNESAAHLAENGRITLMFCAFDGAPRIIRLYGHGEVCRPDTPEFAALRPHFAAALPPARQIIRINLARVHSSCGYAVPLMALQGERDDLVRWSERKGEEGLVDYQRRNNAVSIDGLPAPGIVPAQEAE